MYPLIQVNHNPGLRRWRVILGVAEIVDGLVRLLSLGMLVTNLPIRAARLGAKSNLTQLKKEI